MFIGQSEAYNERSKFYKDKWMFVKNIKKIPKTKNNFLDGFEINPYPWFGIWKPDIYGGRIIYLLLTFLWALSNDRERGDVELFFTLVPKVL